MIKYFIFFTALLYSCCHAGKVAGKKGVVSKEKSKATKNHTDGSKAPSTHKNSTKPANSTLADSKDLSSPVKLALDSTAVNATALLTTCTENPTRESILRDATICNQACFKLEQLSKIDITNIGRGCLWHLSRREDILRDMSPETAAQILASRILDIPDDARLLGAVMRRNDWAKNKAEAFMVAAAGSSDFASALAQGVAEKNPELAGLVFSPDNADKHGPGCAKLTSAMLPYISTTFFAKMQRNCFRNIPPAAFEGLGEHQFKAIKPELLREINGQQAAKIPTSAFFGMTADQIEDWGPPYNPPKEEKVEKKSSTTFGKKKGKKGGKGKKDKKGKKGEKDKKEVEPVKTTTKDDQAAANHPCAEAKRMLTAIKPPLRAHLRSRCKVTESASVANRPDYLTVGLLLAGFSLWI